jgi:small subunit ribosomal protein S17
MTEETENTEIEETPEAEAPVAEVEETEVVAELSADVEEPAAEADPEPEESPAKPVAEAAPAEESVADEPDDAEEAQPMAAEAEEATQPAAEEPGEDTAPAAVSEPKKKRKRLPRPERPGKTRRKRVPATERKPITRLEKPEHARGRRQERQGTVVSAASDKTIVVRVDVVKVHPRYKKVIRRSTRLHAHDEENQAKLGDVVRVVETRPLSRMKRWRLQEIVEAAK